MRTYRSDDWSEVIFIRANRYIGMLLYCGSVSVVTSLHILSITQHKGYCVLIMRNDDIAGALRQHVDDCSWSVVHGTREVNTCMSGIIIVSIVVVVVVVVVVVIVEVVGPVSLDKILVHWRYLNMAVGIFQRHRRHE